MLQHSLKTILSTIATPTGKKRTIYNLGPVGGINSKFIILFFIALPFLEYAAVFNDYVFEKLGIATCIVLYIVFLSIVMIIIFATTWKIKKSTIKKIEPQWNNFFEGIDLSMVLSNGITPYSKFFDYYSNAIEDNIPEEELYDYLKNSFVLMQEENKELLEAINRDNSH